MLDRVVVEETLLGLLGKIAWLQQIFCQVSMETYAGGARPERFAHGAKGYRRSVDGIDYLDRWSTNGAMTHGTICLSRLGTVLWQMSYYGHMKDDHALSRFLRQSLAAAYGTHRFIGGRGPSEFMSPTSPGLGQLVYQNRLFHNEGFALFSGRDSIHLLTWPQEVLYSHIYCGGIVAPLMEILP